MRSSSMSGWLKRTESSSSCWRCLCLIIDHHQYLLNRHQVFQLMVIKVVGNYIHLGSVLVFVDKQEHADGLLKVFNRILALIEIIHVELIRIFHINHSNRIFHVNFSIRIFHRQLFKQDISLSTIQREDLI